MASSLLVSAFLVMLVVGLFVVGKGATMLANRDKRWDGIALAAFGFALLNFGGFLWVVNRLEELITKR